MNDLLSLIDQDTEDPEMVPEILPVDARLSVQGSTTHFIELFEKAVAVVPSKAIIPNTAYVLLETFDATTDTLAYTQVTATDGSRCVAALDDNLKISMFGSALLPGKKVLDILKLAPEESVTLTVLGSSATIRSGRALWTVQTPVGDSLPPFPDTDDIQLHTIEKKGFLRALETARKAVATSTARLSLMQVKIAQGAIVACDGARLHKVEIEDFPKALKFTLPLALLDDAIKFLKQYQAEQFQFGANKATVVFHFGRDLLMGQRLLLEYPNVESLTLAPAMLNEETLTVNVPELINVVKRVRVTADPEFSSIYLNIRPLKKDKTVFWRMAVSARDRSKNSSMEQIDVQYDGGFKAKEICLNHKHLLDLLESLESEEASFKLGDKKSPLYIKDGALTAVVSPMVISF